MAALVFVHKAVVVACAVVLCTFLGGRKPVQQVVAAYLQMIAIRDIVSGYTLYTRRKSDDQI